MKTKIISGILISIALLTSSGKAVNKVDKTSDRTPASAVTDRKDLISSFRCEKFSGGLGDLKLKMIENCNLDNPFSSSMSRTVGGEEVYMFCCHLAK